MKNLFLVVTIVFGIFGLVYGVAYLTHGVVTTYALGTRDIEFVFYVTDAVTEKPISDAVIVVRPEQFWKEPANESIKLVTDAEGRARILRKDHAVEDVIRPFRKTIVLGDTTWCSV